jgi:hypothetical protein
LYRLNNKQIHLEYAANLIQQSHNAKCRVLKGPGRHFCRKEDAIIPLLRGEGNSSQGIKKSPRGYRGI